MTKYQQEILKKSFRTNPYPSKQEQCQLATTLDTRQEVINNWFTNWRRKKENKRILRGSE